MANLLQSAADLARNAFNQLTHTVGNDFHALQQQVQKVLPAQTPTHNTPAPSFQQIQQAASNIGKTFTTAFNQPASFHSKPIGGLVSQNIAAIPKQPALPQFGKFSPNNAQVFNNVVAPLWQVPLRTAAQLKQTPVVQDLLPGQNLPNNPINPQGVGKLAFGSEPLVNYEQRYKQGFQIPIVGTTVKGTASLPLFAGGIALDLSGLSVGEKTAATEAINLAKKATTAQGFTKALLTAKPDVTHFVTSIINNSKSPVNSVSDFYNVVNKAGAMENLKNLMRYPADLEARGYSPAQIKKISATDYKTIVANNTQPFEHPTFKTPQVDLVSYEDAFKNGDTKTLDSLSVLHPKDSRFQIHNEVLNTPPTDDPKWLETHGNTFDLTNKIRAEKDPQGVTEPLQNIIEKDYNAVKNKVNILDYLRTPDRVFQKIGMGNEAQLLRKQYDTYTVQLPKELQKITDWAQRAPNENQQIFQWLDGNKGVTLTPQAKQVAGEIKNYLAGWADKLNLPQDRRISNYVTHLFPRGAIQEEFDPDVAKLIRGKVASSVYDPFLQERKNAPDYNEDTWQALSAYTKRATRKFFMDPALSEVEKKAQALPEESYNYVKQFVAHTNMQPTQLDSLVDNAIKSTPIGYKLGQRPVASITQGTRKAVFRGLLGLNPGSALRNLQQSTNTSALIGNKAWLQGAIKTVQHLPRFLSGADTELNQVGVIGKDLAGVDQTINPVNKFWEKTDKGLFYMFNQAENINRGIAYFGAKQQALDKGLTEKKAIDYAKQIVRKTQFNYDVIDLPVALQSDIAKTIFQFAKYPVAQTEFLAEMGGKALKGDKQAILGSVRFIASNLLFIATIGKALGLDPSSMLPQFRFGIPPTAQAPVGFAKGLLGTPDEYGNVPKGNPIQRAFENKDFRKGVTNYIPAGGQIKKTLEAANAINEGGSYTPSGNLRFPITNKAQALAFGVYSTPEGKAYINNKTGGANLTPQEQDAQDFEQGLKANDTQATKLENQMYQQFDAAQPDRRKLLLQQWAQEGTLTKPMLQNFVNRKKLQMQQDAGEYAKAFSELSNDDHKALYLTHLMQTKSAAEKQIILEQLQAAQLLTPSLSKALQRLQQIPASTGQ